MILFWNLPLCNYLVLIQLSLFYSDDDSDVEVSDHMTGSQEKVFDFLNSANTVELLQIPSCTQNKVNAILEARPFNGWKELVSTFFFNLREAKLQL